MITSRAENSEIQVRIQEILIGGAGIPYILELVPLEKPQLRLNPHPGATNCY